MHLSFQISYLAVRILYLIRLELARGVLSDTTFTNRWVVVSFAAAFPPIHIFSPTIASPAATSKSYKRIVFLKMHGGQIWPFECHSPLLLSLCVLG